MSVMLHPNYAESCVRVDGRAYYWDGPLSCYRPGYGPYGPTGAIGDWREAGPHQAERIRSETNA